MHQLHEAGSTDGEYGDDTGKPQENSDVMGMVRGLIDLLDTIISLGSTKLVLPLQMLSEILNAVAGVHRFDPSADNGCRGRQASKSG